MKPAAPSAVPLDSLLAFCKARISSSCEGIVRARARAGGRPPRWRQHLMWGLRGRPRFTNANQGFSQAQRRHAALRKQLSAHALRAATLFG